MDRYGNKAKDLVQELKRSDWLPPYNDDGIRQVINEINALDTAAEEKMSNYGPDLADHPNLQCVMMIHHQALKRNKRCILAYLHYRVNKIKKLRWEVGAMIPNEFQKSLSSQEMNFFSNYDRLLSEYMQGFHLDLTADLQPPKDLYIEVRVVKDCGEVLTESGPIHLAMNTRHYLRRSDVEHLIRQGALVQIQSE